MYTQRCENPSCYEVVLDDPTFESRLKMFDSNLSLVFDQFRQRWMILEKAYDGSGYNVIIVAEDENGNPKRLGEWVFNRLWVYRKRYEAKRDIGVDRWFDQLLYEAEAQRMEMDKKATEEGQYRLIDDITRWKKAARELDNFPASDVTAGYPKVTPERKLYADSRDESANGGDEKHVIGEVSSTS